MHKRLLLVAFLLSACVEQTPTNTIGQVDAGHVQQPESSDAGSNVPEESVDAGDSTPPITNNDGGIENPTEASVDCGSVDSAVLTLSLDDDNLKPRLNRSTTDGSMEHFEVGIATREGMGAIFEETPRVIESLPYRWICDDHDLTFDFVDNDDSGTLDGEANNTDRLSRIVVGASSSLIFLGHIVNSITAETLMTLASGDNYAVHTLQETVQMVVFPSLGFSFLISIVDVTETVSTHTDVLNGDLVSLSFFKPQENDNWGAPINFGNVSITVDTDTISAASGISGGSSFSAIPPILGDDYDVNGSIEGEDYQANILTYASLGLRFVEGCAELPVVGYYCSGKVTVIVISSPFMGVDPANGLRLGSTMTEIETALGTGSVRIDEESGGEIYVYGASSPKIGVIYVLDMAGVQRAVAYILNYIDDI